jgi:hypothetical protein
MNLNCSVSTWRLISIGAICFVLFVSASAANAITKTKPTTPVARLGRPFKLNVGRQVTLERLRIKFAAVTQDSRCPADVTCVWAGNAAVRLDVSTNRSNSKSLTLNTGRSPSSANEAQYQGYNLKLVDLSPYPRSDRKIAAGDYVVTMLVSKAARKSSVNNQTENLILQLESEGREATLKNDVAATDRLLAENWMNVNPDGSVTTKAQLMALLKAGSFKIMSIENDEVLVRVFASMAVVTGRSTTTRGQGNEIISRQVRFTRIYDGSGGRWQVVSAHNTIIRQS